MACKTLNLILFSGLAADSNVFEAQRAHFGELLHVVPWLEPIANESLSDYARRMVGPYKNLPNLVLGGASFGGIVALHAAEHLPVRGVILIGSARDPSRLPWIARWTRPFAWLAQWIPVGALKLLAKLILLVKPWPKSLRHVRSVVGQFSIASSNVFRWSLHQLLCWSSPVQLEVPIFEIHGDHDRIIPLPKDFYGSVIPGAGHVISLSHPGEVNQFIEQTLLILDQPKD